MAFKAFTQTHVYLKQAAPKEKDKSGIQCLECCDQNVYLGTKDATVQHLILPSRTSGDLSAVQSKTREGRTRKLGSSGPVAQLRAVPVFNHLLVLWDRGVSAHNMFSLEPVPTLQKIQHVSLFEVCDTSPTVQAGGVRMLTASSRRKAIRIHVVGVDKWEAVKEIPLPQEAVALAVDGTSLCVATCNRYLLCDVQTGCSEELFPHRHNRERVLVTSVGQGEFLLNGPESLGIFVMKTAICQRPPLQWPREVLAAGVCFPYVLVLQPQVLSVYSMLDQQHKQTVSLSGAKGLLSTPGTPGVRVSPKPEQSVDKEKSEKSVDKEKQQLRLPSFALIQSIVLAPTVSETPETNISSDGVLAFTDRDLVSLRLVPLEDQIQALVAHERFEEALLLLDGVQSHRPLDSYKELHKTISCLAGFVHFYQEGFSEARDLFIKGELDPREIIHLFPGTQSFLCEDFQSQFDGVNKGRDLQVLWQEDRSTFHHYLDFLRDFLRAVGRTEQGLRCRMEVDCALLRLLTELGDTENLQQLVELPNKCVLRHCVPILEQHKRYFALGSLYQSHGKLSDAIETWMKVADGSYRDTSCLDVDVHGHIVWTLSQLEDRDTVWKFADWTVQRNQEVGVRIFTTRPPDGRLETHDVLDLLEKYPQALLLYLEFLIHGLNNEEERRHNQLALAYVAQTLREEEERESHPRVTRGKLQQLLWESKFYDVSTVYERIKSTALHTEKAILLCRAGEHSRALQVLVLQEKNLQAAEAFCGRAAQGQGSQFRQALLLTLLQIYLGSEDLTGAAADLLNNNPGVFAAEKVIQLLPDSWSVQLVSQFLVGSLRETLHQARMARLQMALTQAELMRHKISWMRASRTQVKLDKKQKCHVCQRCFAEPQFTCSPHGELTHTGCTGFPAL